MMFNKKDAKTIPDPWELPDPKIKINPILATEKSTPKPQQAIASAGNPRAKRLPEHHEKPTTVLLQDWLKLKAAEAEELTIGIRSALGLLYWLES